MVSGNVSTCVVSCATFGCPSRYRGVMLYHSLLYALSVARHLNRHTKWKAHKVVMIADHFAVVDHTWERNT